MQHVIIGLDTPELVRELDVSGPTAIHLDIDEDDDEESDDEEDDDVDEDEDDEDEDYDEVAILSFNQLGFSSILVYLRNLAQPILNDYVQEWVSDLEDDDDDEDDDESLGDWAKLDTMRTTHPMYFAKRLAEVKF